MWPWKRAGPGGATTSSRRTDWLGLAYWDEQKGCACTERRRRLDRPAPPAHAIRTGS